MAEFTNSKRTYWKNTANLDWLINTFEKRQDNTSCVHDLARIFQPEGKIDEELMNVICWNVYVLRHKGIVKIIKKDFCEDLHRTHNFYRIRQAYERKDDMTPTYTYKKTRRKKQSNMKQIFKMEKPVQTTIKQKSTDSLARRVVNSNLTDNDKLEILKEIL